MVTINKFQNTLRAIINKFHNKTEEYRKKNTLDAIETDDKFKRDISSFEPTAPLSTDTLSNPSTYEKLDQNLQRNITFELKERMPVLYITTDNQCNKNDDNNEAEVYTELYDMKISQNIMTLTEKILNAKSTYHNVTYIHLKYFLIVFITLENNLVYSKKYPVEDEQWILAYTSKHLDKSIHVVVYDRDNNSFVDYLNNKKSAYTIPIDIDTPLSTITPELGMEQHVKEIERYNLSQQPTLPSPIQSNKGSVYYIGKKSS